MINEEQVQPECVTWVKGVDRQDIAEHVVDNIVEKINGAVQKQGRASILLSGGSTPKKAYELLAKAPLSWDALQISLSDERRVIDGHADSNAVMVWQTLLASHPQVQWFPLWQTGWTEDHIAELKARVSELQRPFDVVLLGMGEDGHFASLFPGCEASQIALERKSDELLCTSAPSAPQRRISWSMDALLESKNLMIYITGQKKKEIFEAAFNRESAEYKLPIGYFLRALQQDNKTCTVFWAP